VNAIEIVDVTLRDGIQPIGPWIPTERKIALLHSLAATGLRRMEVGAFVSANAMPQMRDTLAVLEAALAIPGMRAQVLVPTARRAAEALAAGARELAFVLSVSEAHNQANLRRSVDESVADYGRFVNETPPDIAIRLNLATSFDCPFTGRVAEDAVISLLGRLLPLRPEVEVGLCDTTGRATPDQVDRLVALAIAHYPGVDRWAFHGHDTYAMGTANAYAAYNAGVRVIDAASGGLGGCPFAPGATGNVATEDLVWMFEKMGVSTGVDLDRLVVVAEEAAALPGGLSGGRVRQAVLAQARRRVAAAGA
jgi:hydroxymethylglutaryl-CoA lyase